LRYSDWNAFSNAINMQIDHSINARLRFVVSAAGAIRNREEFQFGQIGTVAPVGTPSTTQPAVDLPSQGLGDTAAQSLFFGSRILTANVHTGIQYSLSPRLSITGGIAGTRMQYLQNRRDGVQTNGLIPQVTALLGDVSVSYDLTPRTSIGASFDTSRQQSRLQDAIITNGRVSVERAMSQRWFVNAYAGAGRFRSLQRTDITSEQLQYLAGGGVTYRSYAHTITGSFDRRVSDMYGIGASNTRALTGLWRWAPLRAPAWIALGFSRTELQSFAFPATTWRGTAEVGRRIGGNIAIVGGYAYMGYSNVAFQTNGMLGQNAVRIALSWIPQAQAVTQP
jgi:hypothetical protein